MRISVPTRSIYVYAMAAATIIALAIMWFMLSQLFEVYRVIGNDLAWSMGTDTATYTNVDTFMQNINTYMLPIMLIVLTYWAFKYSQSKGEPVYGY